MKAILILFLITIYTLPMNAQDTLKKYQDPTLPIEERVNDLVDRLTLEEKVGQLIFNAEAIPRLNIPEYNWWNEALHGVARNGRATIFPQAIAFGATFDTILVQRIAEAISLEARAKYNICSAKDFRDIYQGLTFWSPNVNIFRDPRWGRGHETYGEDPYLTSRIGVSFVKGLQGDHPKYLQAAACAKHYAVHSGPEALRHEFDAVVTMKDLWETYLPAFKALVTEAGVEGVMGAYNRTNGDPCCAHPYLMDEVLRSQWGFEGYYTSDCWAIVDFYQGHNVVETKEEAVAMAIKSGCNLNCGDSYPALLDAVKQGLVTEMDIDTNLTQLLKTRFRLGLFDPEGSVPFDSISADVIANDDHLSLSRETAVKSIVLLKNSESTLPLEKDLRKIYVTGPLATHVQGLLANYYGVSDNLVTILEGIVGKVDPATKVEYKQGVLLDRENVNPIDWFSGEASSSDVTIACLGISQLLEGEEGEAIASPYKGDRMDIKLPENQIKFLKTLRENANKLVVVLVGGSPIACEEVYEMADALIYVWYPGEQGGNAVADIIFGDALPTGRLPITFPRSIEDIPPYEDYNMAGRTYKYMEVEPLFPFGFGLSYNQYEYADLTISNKDISKDELLIAEFSVTNKGNYAGEEVMQFYLSALNKDLNAPLFDLKKFEKIYLEPGETKTLQYEITPEMMETVNENGERVIAQGKYKLYIGGSSPLERSYELGAAKHQIVEFSIN